MSITELHKLPAMEKLKIIEELWSDLIYDGYTTLLRQMSGR